MTQEQINKIWDDYILAPEHFTCHYCKHNLGTTDCEGCPIYCQTHSED